MDEAKSLSHSKWECKLCAAAHNLHDVLFVIMRSELSIALIRLGFLTVDST